MPSMSFYIGTFTAIHSVLYCLFSILSFTGLFKESFLLSINILSLFSLPFFTFFCNISMLYFGREYRKYYKTSYCDWTSLCYSVLILFNIVLLTAAFLTRTGTSAIFIENHSMFFAAFVINVFIPFFLVPILSAIGCGFYKKYFLTLGILCHVLGIVLMWIVFIMVMGQACDDQSIASSLFNMFPYKLFLNIKIHGFFSLLFFLAIFLTFLGYISHIFIITAINGFMLKRAFSKYVVFFICVPILFQTISFISARIIKFDYELTKTQFIVPLTVDGLEILYYNGETPNEAFWNEFNSKVASIGKDGIKSVSEIIDKVDKIPKCHRDFTFYIGGKSQDLESVSTYCVNLKLSMLKSIKAKDAAEAMRIARRALKLDTFLLGDVYASAGLWHVFICKDILQQFAKSDFASVDNLKEINTALAENEKKIDGYYNNVNFWHTLCLSTMWEIRQKEDRIDVGGGNSMPVPSLRELFYIFPQQYCAYIRNQDKESDNAVVNGGNAVMLKMRDDAFEACRILSSNK